MQMRTNKALEFLDKLEGIGFAQPNPSPSVSESARPVAFENHTQKD